MSRPHPSHFTGEIERVDEGDDGTVTIHVRAPHRTHRLHDSRQTLAPFLRRWAEAGCPAVHVHEDGHLSLARGSGLNRRDAR